MNNVNKVTCGRIYRHRENLNEAIHGLVDRKRKSMGEQLRTHDSPDLDFTEHLILSQVSSFSVCSMWTYAQLQDCTLLTCS